MKIRFLSRLQIGFRRLLIGISLLAIAGLAYTRTAHFQWLLELEVVEILERASGGRVTLDGFSFSIVTRQAHLRGLSLSSGALGDPLFLRAGSVLVQLRVIPLLFGKTELAMVRVDRPQIRLNHPPKPQPRDPRRSPLDPLFDLSIGRLEVVDGRWFWNESRGKLHFAADHVSAALIYDPARDRYVGNAGARNLLLNARGAKPISAQGRVRLVLERRALEIVELIGETPRSRVNARGALRDFRNPVTQLTYQASIDLMEAASLLGWDDMRSGMMTVKGSARLQPDSLRATGETKLERAGFTAFPEISGSATFEINGNSAVLRPVRLYALGGEAEGRIRIEDLTGSPKGTWEGKTDGISLNALAQVVDALAPGADLEKLRLVGSLSGESEASFRSAGNWEIAARVFFRPPGVVPPGFVPLRGAADLHYSSAGERLALRNTVIETPASRLTLSGNTAGAVRSTGDLGLDGAVRSKSDLGLDGAVRSKGDLGSDGEGRFEVSIATTNAAEFAARWTPPVDLQGRAEFRGTATGTLRAPVLNGRATVDRFSFRDKVYDRFEGDVLLSTTRLELKSGRLHRGAATLELDAGFALSGGVIDESAPFRAAVRLRQGEIADMQDFLEVNYPIAGKINASLTAGGSLKDPALKGSAEVTGGEVYGEKFDHAKSEVSLDRRVLKADNLVLSRGLGRVNGTVTVETEKREFRFDLAARDLALAGFTWLHSERYALTGTLDGRMSGSIEEKVGIPNGRAQLNVRDLAVNRERIGDLAAGLQTEGDRLLVRVRSSVRQGSLNALGNIRMEAPHRFEGRLEFTGLSLDPLLETYLADRVSYRSSGDGTLDVAGEWRKWESLEAAAVFSRVEGTFGKISLKNAGPWRGRYHDQSFVIDALRLTGKETDLTVSGTVARAGPMSLRAAGRMDLGIVELLRPGATASGRVVWDANLEGTWESPQMNGRLEVVDAMLAVEGFPNTLGRLNGVVRFSRTGMRIEKLAGESGGGQVAFTGQLDYGRSPASFQVRMQANGVRMRYPQGVSTVLNAQLALAGTSERNLLSGEVTIVSAGVSSTFDLAEALDQMKQASEPVGGDTLARSMDLNVRVTSATDIRFVSARTRNLEAQLDLRLRGTAAEPALLGKVNINQGEVNFAGNLYTINRGEISFVNPFRIDPILNLDLSSRAQQYDISLDFTGPLDKLRVNYRSDPPLPAADIQSLLLLGRKPIAGDAAASNPARAQVGSDAILSQALRHSMDSRVERFFGVSRLKIDPQAGGPLSNSTARLTLEQQVAPDVTFTYVTSLSRTQQQVIQVEWAVSRRLSIFATRDENGLFGIDFKFKKRFR